MADTDIPFIVKKVRKVEHAQHSGAWKIAYADFVTAMMAFFLLLWLISMTTPEQKKGIADYFAPPNIAPTTSGAGGVLAGTALSDSATSRMAGSPTEAKTFSPPASNDTSEAVATREAAPGASGPAGAAAAEQADARKLQQQQFHSAAASIRQAWQSMPDVTDIADNLLVEETSKGLDIRIMDQQGRPMFPEGSKFPLEPARDAIAAIAPILQQLSNPVSISGYTAAGTNYANPRYGDWDLTADRANVVRGILGEFGLSNDHVTAVTGHGASEPLFPNDPYLAGNSRVEITVLYKPPPVPADLQP